MNIILLIVHTQYQTQYIHRTHAQYTHADDRIQCTMHRLQRRLVNKDDRAVILLKVLVKLHCRPN